MMVSGQMATGGEWLAAGWQRAEWLASRRWFPVVINIGALLLLAYGLATWTWALFRPQVPQVMPENARQAPMAATFDVQSLLASQLFGQAPLGAASQSLENIPISSLNLVLSGVVSAGGASIALISVNGQPQEPFAIGQEITGGAVLQAVYPDRALLMRGGVTESLMLEGMSKGLPDVMVPDEEAGAPPVRSYPGIVERGQNQYQVPRNLITEQMRKPQEIFTQALMVPNAGGGFLVREIQPGSLYEKLGLRIGDVIRSVNGRPVNTVDDAMQAYQRVSNQRDVRVEVVRGGQPTTLQYSFQ